MSGVWRVRVGRGGGSKHPIPLHSAPSHPIPLHPIPSCPIPSDTVLPARCPAEARALFSSQYYFFSSSFSFSFTFSRLLTPRQPSLSPFQSL